MRRTRDFPLSKSVGIILFTTPGNTEAKRLMAGIAGLFENCPPEFCDSLLFQAYDDIRDIDAGIEAYKDVMRKYKTPGTDIYKVVSRPNGSPPLMAGLPNQMTHYECSPDMLQNQYQSAMSVSSFETFAYLQQQQPQLNASKIQEFLAAKLQPSPLGAPAPQASPDAPPASPETQASLAPLASPDASPDASPTSSAASSVASSVSSVSSAASPAASPAQLALPDADQKYLHKDNMPVNLPTGKKNKSQQPPISRPPSKSPRQSQVSADVADSKKDLSFADIAATPNKSTPNAGAASQPTGILKKPAPHAHPAPVNFCCKIVTSADIAKETPRYATDQDGSPIFNEHNERKPNPPMTCAAWLANPYKGCPLPKCTLCHEVVRVSIDKHKSLVHMILPEGYLVPRNYSAMPIKRKDGTVEIFYNTRKTYGFTTEQIKDEEKKSIGLEMGKDILIKAGKKGSQYVFRIVPIETFKQRFRPGKKFEPNDYMAAFKTDRIPADLDKWDGEVIIMDELPDNYYCTRWPGQ